MIFFITQVDVSELSPPEPMEKILSVLARLEENEIILVTHRLVPLPLFKILDDRHFQYSAIEKSKKSNQLISFYVWKSKDPAVRLFLKKGGGNV